MGYVTRHRSPIFPQPHPSPVVHPPRAAAGWLRRSGILRGMSVDTDRRARFEAVAAQVWDPLQQYVRRRMPGDGADDVIADVLLVLWRRLDDVPEDAPMPWTYGVARRCLANARRADDRRLRVVQRLAAEPPSGPVDDGDGDGELQEAMERLRPAEREVLTLWAWEGLEPRDLAVVLGCSAGAAAVRLSRARTALARQLGKDRPAAGHRDVRGGGRRA